MPFRVVFLTHNFPRYSGDLSGAFLATLAHSLIARGHEIRVLAPSDLGEVGAPEFEGIPVTRVRYAPPAHETLAYRGNMQDAIRHASGWRALVGLWRSLRRAAATELEKGADVVHAHWWVPGGLATPPGPPMVLTVHGTDGALLKRSSLARWVAAPVFRRASVVTAVSQSLATDLRAATGRELSASHVQPMPVDVSGFTSWSEGGTGLIVVARLTPQKRIHLALEAVAVMKKQGRPVPLRIAGDGAERETLEARADALGVRDLVTFLGAVPPADVPRILANADAMIFPAEGEGFGLVAAESFMAGVPVVACRDGGGVLDIVPTEGAGRISEPEAASLAQAITSVIDDRQAKAEARRSGLLWRTQLAPDTVATACEGWYQEATSA
ncbi:MAG: glycosyltransferase family 4 protein [Gemmatimonadota bacterium]